MDGVADTLAPRSGGRDGVGGAVDEASLREGVLRGDPDALRAFYALAMRPLYTFCYFRLGRDHHATEEVVQETLLHALEVLAEFDPERGGLHTWLAYLSRNAIRRANETRRRFVSQIVPERASEPESPGLEQAARVSVALARLPAHYRAVLERKYFEGDPVRAIARDQVTTEKAVESLLARAREAFRIEFLSLEAEA
jgi:RNA polymerase sigma-70 factor (ECF subfamily)